LIPAPLGGHARFGCFFPACSKTKIRPLFPRAEVTVGPRGPAGSQFLQNGRVLFPTQRLPPNISCFAIWEPFIIFPRNPANGPAPLGNLLAPSCRPHSLGFLCCLLFSPCPAGFDLSVQRLDDPAMATRVLAMCPELVRFPRSRLFCLLHPLDQSLGFFRAFFPVGACWPSGSIREGFLRLFSVPSGRSVMDE